MHLLLVEDDLDLGMELQRALARHGLTSEWVRSVQRARAMLEAESGESGENGRRFDCVLLDLSLPDGDGMELLRHWRSRQVTVPVIVVTARDALADRIAALDTGADDYLVKPCAPIEIASRVHAVVRRSAGHASQLWSVGDLKVDMSRREVQVGGQPVSLSPKEYRIVVELARVPEGVVSKHRLAQALAPLSEPMEFSALEWHVCNLRRKIGTQKIRTVRGVGYCMTSP